MLSKLFPDAEVIETHISKVFLTGEYAYKIKKPVDYGFIDFSSLEKRKYYCHEEIRLNSKLSGIYLGVVSITSDGNIDGQGEVIEYGVKMKQMKGSLMKDIIQDIGKKDMDHIISILSDFYKKSYTDEKISSYGSIEEIRKSTEDNFEKAKPLFDIRPIKKASDRFLEDYSWLFEKRMKQGRIMECHGDLHTGNIMFADRIEIFDCIEFNESFKNIDIASDIAFLAMDLDFHARADLSSYLVEQFVGRTQDYEILKLLNFYKCYRACVRCKVAILSQDNGLAQKYYELALDYSRKLELRYSMKDVVFITCGPTGTGKSRIARRFSKWFALELLQTDAIRKELFEGGKTDYGQGIYSEDKRYMVYEEMFKRADSKDAVIMDAAFLTKGLRKKADIKSRFFILYRHVDDETAKAWISRRKDSISDGTWEVYLEQKKAFDGFEGEPVIHGKYPEELFDKVIQKILS